MDATDKGEPVDRVAPFEVPRKRAGSLLKGYLQEHWLAPESVRKAARPEELRGVLVPFYVFDAVARSRFSATVGIHWYRTETYTTTVDGKTVTRTRQVKETDWHPFQGSHARRWMDHLVSASRGLVEAEANALEPFDVGKALPWDPSLVAGVEAEHPTIPHEEARETAGQELARLEQQTIASRHLPGDTHRSLQSSTASEIERMQLVLLPVWVAAFPGPKGSIRLLVNGQTGEVVGQVPRSWTKVGCLIAVIVAIAGIVIAVILLSSTIAAVVAS